MQFKASKKLLDPKKMARKVQKLEDRLKTAEKTIKQLKLQYSDMQVTLATFAGIRHEMEIFKKKSEKAVESTKRLQVKVNKSEALESVTISKNALRSASTTDISVNNETFNVAKFIRTEFANSPSFAATCRNVEDFCVAAVKLFVDKPEHKNLPWTYAMGGKSRNNAFVQLPTKFVEDICCKFLQ
uniref:Uncharacterized protein n=1 Tax=Panagrolaimus davidi TaxID=227884 RepID=A0A914QT09_9BILA